MILTVYLEFDKPYGEYHTPGCGRCSRCDKVRGLITQFARDEEENCVSFVDEVWFYFPFKLPWEVFLEIMSYDVRFPKAFEFVLTWLPPLTDEEGEWIEY